MFFALAVIVLGIVASIVLPVHIFGFLALFGASMSPLVMCSHITMGVFIRNLLVTFISLQFGYGVGFGVRAFFSKDITG